MEGLGDLTPTQENAMGKLINGKPCQPKEVPAGASFKGGKGK